MIHIRLIELVSDKKLFTRSISGNKTTFFLGWELLFMNNFQKLYLLFVVFLRVPFSIF